MQDNQITSQVEHIDQLFNDLKQDETQNALAEKAENTLFANDEAKKNTFQTINAFLDDYLANGRHQPIDQWLKFRLTNILIFGKVSKRKSTRQIPLLARLKVLQPIK